MKVSDLLMITRNKKLLITLGMAGVITGIGIRGNGTIVKAANLENKNTTNISDKKKSVPMTDLLDIAQGQIVSHTTGHSTDSINISSPFGSYSTETTTVTDTKKDKNGKTVKEITTTDSKGNSKTTYEVDYNGKKVPTAIKDQKHEHNVKPTKPKEKPVAPTVKPTPKPQPIKPTIPTTEPEEVKPSEPVKPVIVNKKPSLGRIVSSSTSTSTTSITVGGFHREIKIITLTEKDNTGKVVITTTKIQPNGQKEVSYEVKYEKPAEVKPIEPTKPVIKPTPVIPTEPVKPTKPEEIKPSEKPIAKPSEEKPTIKPSEEIPTIKPEIKPHEDEKPVIDNPIISPTIDPVIKPEEAIKPIEPSIKDTIKSAIQEDLDKDRQDVISTNKPTEENNNNSSIIEPLIAKSNNSIIKPNSTTKSDNNVVNTSTTKSINSYKNILPKTGSNVNTNSLGVFGTILSAIGITLFRKRK